MVKCGNCDNSLICGRCEGEFVISNQEDYETFYDPISEVYCPRCGHLLICQSCGTAYDGGESEFGPREDRHHYSF